jgi:hypothetical protein
MILIPVQTDANGIQYPSHPFPDNAIAVSCDGKNYSVYQPGDTIPEIKMPTSN